MNKSLAHLWKQTIYSIQAFSKIVSFIVQALNSVGNINQIDKTLYRQNFGLKFSK